MITQSKESQSGLSPEGALQLLKEGNERFVNRSMTPRDLIEQVSITGSGQYPFATVLHCIDSRVSAELIFDQGIGDLFSIRIAGNFINDDILGSMEFATKLAGTKVLVVLGHTHCGAVKGACDHVEMGNLTGMLSKITPIVNKVEKHYDEKGSKNEELVQEVAELNVKHGLDVIRHRSPIIADMEESGDLLIIGGMYDIKSGKVTFYS
ncbi:MAG: carbonic anhydrase [Flavobacteriales bacterium]|nr:carbonic anhydrase [Flavobacteriales bacterium]